MSCSKDKRRKECKYLTLIQREIEVLALSEKKKKKVQKRFSFREDLHVFISRHRLHKMFRNFKNISDVKVPERFLARRHIPSVAP